MRSIIQVKYKNIDLIKTNFHFERKHDIKIKDDKQLDCFKYVSFLEKYLKTPFPKKI